MWYHCYVMEKRKRLLPAADLLFLAVCGCYFIFRTNVLIRFHENTTSFVEHVFIYSLLALALCRLVLLWPEEKRLITGACVMAAALAGISFMNGADSPGAFSVLVLGCAGLKAERLMKLRAVIWLWYTLGMIFGCLCGFFSVFVIYNKGDLRSAWGFPHPVTMATQVLFSVLFLWMAFPSVPDWLFLLLSFVSLWIGMDITYSETGMICSLVLMGFVLLHMIPVQRLLTGKWGRRLLKTARMLLSLSFPLLAAFYFFLVRQLKEGSAFAASVNTWITGRIGLALRGFEEYGVPAFGADYRINAMLGANYNVLDSLYSLVIVRYGWVLLAVMAAGLVFFSWRCFQNGRRRIAYGIVVAAVYSFAEPQLENAHVNLFLCLAFCSLRGEPQAVPGDAEREVRKAERPARLAATAAVGILCILLIRVLPLIFSCMRTVYLQFDWVGKDERVFLLIGAALALLFFFLAGIRQMVFTLWRKQKPSRRVIAVTAVCACLLLAGTWKLHRMVRTEEAAYAEYLEEIAPLMETVLSSAEGAVYADTLPEVFVRRFPEMKRTWRREEELAFEKNASIIASRWVDEKELMVQGYRYLQMSVIHSLYTNDASVVEALRKEGHHIASFYYSVSSVLFNGPENDYQGIPVNTEEEAAKGRVSANLYGVYTAEFDLHFEGGKPAHDLRGEELCTLRAWSVNDEKVIVERKVMGDEVGESGWNTYALTFSGSGLVDLTAIANENYPMLLTEIRYRHTPEYDIFDTRDEKGRIIRREYYDLEGNPAVTGDGASVITYEYDEADNNTVQRYYDGAGAPVMITKGYAGLHRKFDEQKRIIHEHYTGTDGKRIMLSAGYAAVDTAYDADGNAVVIRYYDAKGDLVMLPGGYALLYRDYNDQKQMIRQRTIDTAGNPYPVPAGYCMQEIGYDAAGNATDYYYYDGKKRPVMTTSGYAELHRVFDDAKRIIRESYADTDGNPVLLPAGYAAYEAGYDEAGNGNDYRYFGTDGEPILLANGYAELRRVFNEKKQIVEESYHDGEGKPLMHASGYAVDEREYDAAGNVVLQRFYDTERLPVANVNGVFVVRRQFDDRRKLTWEEYVDPEGNPAERNDGVHAFARVYDAEGNLAEEVFYDVQGEIILP